MKPTVRLEVPHTEKLVSALTHGIANFDPRVVVETGTYLGTGSTRIILDAFGDRKPDCFYTIEVSKQLWRKASLNLSDVPFVRCLWGLSLRKERAREFLITDPLLRELDPALDIYVDFLPDPVGGYLRELEGALGGEEQEACQEGLLEELLSRHKADRPLICLDSAGGTGWLEFQEVLRIQSHNPFLLFLDDINHVKHYRSRRHIESSRDFDIMGLDEGEGWMVAVFRGISY